MFSRVHVCVCAFPWLVSRLHNRISRDFAAVTQTSVCVWERERVERAPRRFRPRPYERSQCDPRLRPSRSPGQHRVKNSLLTHEQEPTIKAALAVPILSLHLSHLCLKAFSSAPPHPPRSIWVMLRFTVCKRCCFSSATPSAGYVSRIPLERIFPVPDSSLMHLIIA